MGNTCSLIDSNVVGYSIYGLFVSWNCETVSVFFYLAVASLGCGRFFIAPLEDVFVKGGKGECVGLFMRKIGRDVAGHPCTSHGAKANQKRIKSGTKAILFAFDWILFHFFSNFARGEV